MPNSILTAYRQAHPEDTRSDEHLNLIFGQTNPELLKLHPDLKVDYESALAPVTLGEKVGHAAGSLARGAASVVSEPLKFSAALQQAADEKIPGASALVGGALPNVIDAFTGNRDRKDRAAYKMGEAVDAVAGVIPLSEDPRVQDSMMFSHVPQGIGYIGGQIGLAALTGGASLALKGPAAIKAAAKLTVSHASMFGSEANDALERELARQETVGEQLDLDKALTKAAAYGLISSAIENKLGAGRFIKKFGIGGANELTARELAQKMVNMKGKDVAVSLTKDVASNFSEEALQRAAQDMIVDGLLTPQAIAREGLAGGVVGGIIGALGLPFQRAAAKRIVEQEGGTVEPPAAPASPAPTPTPTPTPTAPAAPAAPAPEAPTTTATVPEAFADKPKQEQLESNRAKYEDLSKRFTSGDPEAIATVNSLPATERLFFNAINLELSNREGVKPSEEKVQGKEEVAATPQVLPPAASITATPAAPAAAATPPQETAPPSQATTQATPAASPTSPAVYPVGTDSQGVLRDKLGRRVDKDHNIIPEDAPAAEPDIETDEVRQSMLDALEEVPDDVAEAAQKVRTLPASVEVLSTPELIEAKDPETGEVLGGPSRFQVGKNTRVGSVKTDVADPLAVEMGAAKEGDIEKQFRVTVYQGDTPLGHESFDTVEAARDFANERVRRMLGKVDKPAPVSAPVVTTPAQPNPNPPAVVSTKGDTQKFLDRIDVERQFYPQEKKAGQGSRVPAYTPFHSMPATVKDADGKEVETWRKVLEDAAPSSGGKEGGKLESRTVMVFKKPDGSLVAMSVYKTGKPAVWKVAQSVKGEKKGPPVRNIERVMAVEGLTPHALVLTKDKTGGDYIEEFDADSFGKVDEEAKLRVTENLPVAPPPTPALEDQDSDGDGTPQRRTGLEQAQADAAVAVPEVTARGLDVEISPEAAAALVSAVDDLTGDKDVSGYTPEERRTLFDLALDEAFGSNPMAVEGALKALAPDGDTLAAWNTLAERLENAYSKEIPEPQRLELVRRKSGAGSTQKRTTPASPQPEAAVASEEGPADAGATAAGDIGERGDEAESGIDPVPEGEPDSESDGPADPTEGRGPEGAVGDTETDRPGGISDEGKAIVDAELAALFGEPTAPPTPSPKPKSQQPAPNYKSDARKNVAKKQQSANAELNDALKDMRKFFGGTVGSLPGPLLDPEGIKIVTKVIVSMTKKGVYDFAAAVIELRDLLSQQVVEKAKPYIEYVWGTIRDKYDSRLSATGDVTAILSELAKPVAEPPASNRPARIIVAQEKLPKNTPDHVKKGQYPLIDEDQRLGANLMLEAFKTGKKGFLNADGAGFGKTMQLLVVADQVAKQTKKPVQIVTQNDQVRTGRFEVDARRLGIDLRNIEILTYSEFRDRYSGRGSDARAAEEAKRGAAKHGEMFGAILFDEAHNLKNPQTKTHKAFRNLKQNFTVFATATPMDKVEFALYFMSTTMGVDESVLLNRLGLLWYSYQTKFSEVTELRHVEVAGDERSQDTKRRDLIDKLKAMRDEMIASGQFVRREYPFYGKVTNEQLLELDADMRDEQSAIDEFYQAKIESIKGDRDDAVKARRDLAGNRTLELSRWLEPNKVSVIFERALEDLKEGRQVVIVAEGVDTWSSRALSNDRMPSFIALMERELERAGIPYAEIFGAGKKASQVADFQSGKVKVALMTPQSGGTGIDLDDSTGKAPRTMYIATMNFSGDVFQQILGRVSRRNTQTPANVVFVTSDGTSDQRRQAILRDKVTLADLIQGKPEMTEGELEEAYGIGMADDVSEGYQPRKSADKVDRPAPEPGKIVVVENATYRGRPGVAIAGDTYPYRAQIGRGGIGGTWDGKAGHWWFPADLANEARSWVKDYEAFKAPPARDYSLSEQATGVDPETLQGLADDIASEFGVTVRVIDNPDWSKNGGAIIRGAANGDGSITINAAGVNSVEEARAVAFHEAIGHQGIRATLGTKFDAFMSDLWSKLTPAQKVEADKIAKRYGFDVNTKTGRINTMSELVAEAAEGGVEKAGLWQRFKDWITELLPWLKSTNGEKIVKQALRRSHQHLTGHKPIHSVLRHRFFQRTHSSPTDQVLWGEQLVSEPIIGDTVEAVAYSIRGTPGGHPHYYWLSPSGEVVDAAQVDKTKFMDSDHAGVAVRILQERYGMQPNTYKSMYGELYRRGWLRGSSNYVETNQPPSSVTRAQRQYLEDRAFANESSITMDINGGPGTSDRSVELIPKPTRDLSVTQSVSEDPVIRLERAASLNNHQAHLERKLAAKVKVSGKKDVGAYLRRLLGIKDSEAVKAMLAREAGAQGVTFDQAKEIGGFKSEAVRGEQLRQAYRETQDALLNMGGKASKLAESIENDVKREGALRTALEERDKTILNMQARTAEMSNDFRRMVVQTLRDNARLSRKLGAIEQQIKVLENSPDVPAGYYTAFQNLLSTAMLNDGQTLFDLLESLAIEPAIDFSKPINEIRDTIAGVPSLAFLAENTTEARALLATVVAYAKTRAGTMAAIELRRMKNAGEREAIIAKLRAATGKDIGQSVRALQKSAVLADRAVAAFQQEKSELQALNRKLKRTAEELKVIEQALPIWNEALQKVSAELSVGPEFVAVDGAVLLNPENPNAKSEDIGTFTLSMKAGEVTNQSELDKVLTNQKNFLTTREASTDENAKDATYQAVRRQYLETVKVKEYDPIVRQTGWNAFQLATGPVWKFLEAFGYTSGRQAASLGYRAAGMMKALNPEGTRLATEVDRAQKEVMAVLGKNRAKGFSLSTQQYLDRILRPAVFHLQDGAASDLAEKYTDPKDLDRAMKERAEAILMRDKAVNPIIADRKAEFMRAMWKHVHAQHAMDRYLFEQAQSSNIGVRDESMQVRDPVTGKLVASVRNPIAPGPLPGSRAVNAALADWVQSMKDGGWVAADADKTLAEAGKAYAEDGHDAALAMVKHLFTDTVNREFLAPLAHTAGQSRFTAPALEDGVTKLPANPDKVAEAWADAEGDVIAFLENVHDLHGGTNKAAYVADGLAQIQQLWHVAKGLQETAVPEAKIGQVSAVHGMIPPAMIEARQLQGLPHEWFTLHTYDHVDMLRSLERITANNAFGRDAATLDGYLEQLKKDITADLTKLNSARREANQQLGVNPKGIEGAVIRALGRDEYQRLLRIEKLAGLKPGKEGSARSDRHPALTKALDGLVKFYTHRNHPDYQVQFLQRLVNGLAGMAVNNPATAIYSNTATMEALTRYGAGASSLGTTGRVIGGVARDSFLSLLQAFGYTHIENDQFKKLAMESGAVDNDVYRLSDAWVREVEESSPSYVLRALGQTLGVGVKRAKSQAAPLRPLRPFQTMQKIINANLGAQMIKLVTIRADDVAKFYNTHRDKNPTDYTVKGSDLKHLSKQDQAGFDELNRDLLQIGTSFDAMAKRRLEGGVLVTKDEAKLIFGHIAMNKLSLEGGPGSTPLGLYNNPVLKLMAPLLRWNLLKTGQVSGVGQNSDGRLQAAAFRRNMAALGIMSLGGLALSMLVDLYDEEFLGKKRNIRNNPLTKVLTGDVDDPAELALATVERVSRIGSAGMFGEGLNTIINFKDTPDNRTLSVDQRVLLVSAANSLMRAVSNIANQGTVDYQNVVRPALQAAGMSSLLQYWQMASRVGDFDNLESRYIRRLNAKNYLTVAGRELKMDVARMGGSYAPTPVTPWMAKMEMAAYANDGAGFMEAYRGAVAAARKDHKDPEEYVQRAFPYRHPLRSVFKSQPSKQEYYRILGTLPDDGRRDVVEAVNLFNRYSERIGARPFEGKEERTRATKSLLGSSRSLFDNRERADAMLSLP